MLMLPSQFPMPMGQLTAPQQPPEPQPPQVVEKILPMIRAAQGTVPAVREVRNAPQMVRETARPLPTRVSPSRPDMPVTRITRVARMSRPPERVDGTQPNGLRAQQYGQPGEAIVRPRLAFSAGQFDRTPKPQKRPPALLGGFFKGRKR